MAKTVIVRHRLVTWFEEFEDKFAPGGVNMREHIDHLGSEVEIPDAEYERIVGVNPANDPPFYTDEQAKAIKAGTYRGHDAEVLTRFRGGQFSAPTVEALEDEGPQVQDLSVEELADYISENRLNVQNTVNLAGDTLESIEKVLDAENIATGNDARKGVADALEAKMRAVTT